MNALILAPETDLVVAPATPAPGLTWHVAPGEENRLNVWIQCRDRWLRAKQRKSGGQNTVNAYTNDWNDFFGFFKDWQGKASDGTPAYGLMPWQVGRLHSEIWVQSLQDRGLAPATVIRKVSALSSFYDYAMHDYTIQDPYRGEIALWDHPNPFRVKDLPKVQQVPIFPTQAEVQCLMENICTRRVERGKTIDLYMTAIDLRNLAIIAGMFGTTRRVTEWLDLKWGDISEFVVLDKQGNPETHYKFRYRSKGGDIKHQELPRDLYGVIINYLKAARRWPIGPGEHIFIAHTDTAKRFGQIEEDYDPAAQPLSESYAWALCQRYGEKAGIDLSKCHPHALRHAGARFRRELGADIWDLQGTLGHKNINTTDHYTRIILDQPVDKYADKIGNMLPRQYKLEFGAWATIGEERGNSQERASSTSRRISRLGRRSLAR